MSPGDIGPASNSPCSSEVTVCCIESELVQETMLYVGMLIWGESNDKPLFGSAAPGAIDTEEPSSWEKTGVIVVVIMNGFAKSPMASIMLVIIISLEMMTFMYGMVNFNIKNDI